MAGRARGSAAPSYSQVVTKGGKEAVGRHFKKLVEKSSKARGKETVGRNESQG